MDISPFAFSVVNQHMGGRLASMVRVKQRKPPNHLENILVKRDFWKTTGRFGLLSYTGFWKFLPIFVGGAQFFGGDHFAMMCSVEKLIPKLY